MEITKIMHAYYYGLFSLLSNYIRLSFLLKKSRTKVGFHLFNNHIHHVAFKEHDIWTQYYKDFELIGVLLLKLWLNLRNLITCSLILHWLRQKDKKTILNIRIVGYYPNYIMIMQFIIMRFYEYLLSYDIWNIGIVCIMIVLFVIAWYFFTSIPAQFPLCFIIFRLVLCLQFW